MRPVLALLALLVAGGATAAERPNIVFLLADDLGYGDVGAYGQEMIATPSIDRMAAEGLLFTDHYAGHPTCRPSRLTLLTGQHTGHTAVSTNGPNVLAATDLTVAELAKQAGYVTGGVGKWTGGHATTTGHPNLQGFDFWMGYLDQADAHNYYPTHLWRNFERVRLPGNELLDHPEARGRVSEKRVTYSHDVITDEALAFVRRHRDDPFLLHVHWAIPHVNNERGAILGDGQEVPDYGSYADRDWPKAEKGFAAMIERMDRDVGKILDLLGELGIAERTLVIFTSDNGPYHGTGHRVQFFDSNGVLSGQKGNLKEGGIRVPMIARWPGTITAGATTDHVSAFWDYLPTVCDLLGVEPPAKTDGISYLPTLLGEEQREHEYLFWRNGDRSLAVRAGKWKYFKLGLHHGLFDLSVDPGEQENLSRRHPETLAELQRLAAEAVVPREPAVRTSDRDAPAPPAILSYRHHGKDPIMPRLVALTLALGLLLPALALAGEGDRPATVSVGGEATLQVPPDQAVVRLGVQAQAPVAADAQRAANEVANAILDAVTGLGVPAAAVQTSRLQLFPVYESRPPGRQEFDEPPRVVAYRAANNVAVTLDDLEKIGPVIDGAIEAGANNIDSVDFRLEDDTAARREALSEAVRDAQAKAETIAAALGTPLGAVTEVVEGGVSAPPIVYREQAMARMASDAGTPVAAGTVSVHASVTVRYRLGSEE